METDWRLQLRGPPFPHVPDLKAERVRFGSLAVSSEKYQKIYPTAVECLQRDLEACLTFYSFPKEHWKPIRANNVIERLFGEVKRRSHKMAASFRNEGSCVLLFYAVIRSLKFNKLTMPAASKEQPGSEIFYNSWHTAGNHRVDILPPCYFGALRV